MQSISYADIPQQRKQIDDFVHSENEKVYMVIGADEISLRRFMLNFEEKVIKKGDIVVLKYDIWPREHSRHFLYRWLTETASGKACPDLLAWDELNSANPQLKKQLTLLKTRDQRPLELRMLESIRFIARSIDAEQTLLINITPLSISPDPTLIDFFKSIVNMLPPKTKMIISQCEDDVLVGQKDFCPSNRISVNGNAPGETKELMERYYRCYHEAGTSGRLTRALVHLAYPIGINELSHATEISEDQTRAALASTELASIVVNDDPTCLRLAFPRLFFPREETIRHALAGEMADVDERALTYYWERLSDKPESNAALSHSVIVSRLSNADMAATQALDSYRAKLELGAGDMSEMELQGALAKIGPDRAEIRGRLLLALAEIQESLGRNSDALESLDGAIELLRKTDRRSDLQIAYELRGRAAFALRQIDVAREAFVHALRLARELGSDELIADMLSQNGYLHYTTRQFDEADAMYREALDLYINLSETSTNLGQRGAASQWSNLGHLAYARSDFDQAEDFHRKAIDLYTKLGDKKLIGGQWGYLGHTYFAAQDYGKAVEAYDQAAEFDESVGNPLMAAQRYANMGHCMYALRKPEKAKQFFETALDKYKEQGNADGEAAQYSNLGLVMGDQGKFDRAVEYFNRAKDIYDELGDRINAITQIVRLGHIRRGQHDLVAAKQHYSEAMERYRALDYHLGEGDAAMELGQVNLGLNDYDAAAEDFIHASGVFAKLGHKEKEAMCQLLLAQVKKLQGNHDGSLKLFNDAREFYQKMDNPLGLANISFQIGLIHFDQQQYKLSEQHYREALVIFKEKEDLEGEANVLANLGTLYFQTQTFDKARGELEAALLLLRKMQHPVGLAGVLVNLSFVCEAQRDYSKAYDCLKEALELYKKMKLSEEAKTIDKRLIDLERKADHSLTRMRDEMLSDSSIHSARNGKIGRNDPCPCGSGKKAKKCCYS